LEPLWMKSYKLPDLNRSSSSNIANKRGSTVFTLEKQSKPKSHQIRINYIARKISQDDVCDTTIKQSSAMLLSQIKEEKVENIEELSEAQSDFELTFEGNKNIFHTPGTFASSKYKEPTKGPTIVDGQIIKHSIIGPIEFYEKAQQNVEKAQRIKALGTLDQESNNSTVDRKFSRAPSSTNSFEEGAGNSRTGTATSFAMKKALMKGRVKDLKEVKIRKEDLLKKFDQLKENEHRFYQYEARRYSNLSYGDRLNQTKEERCLYKFDEANSTWDKNVIRMTQRIGKIPENSVMLRSGHYREKVEMANVLEAGKTMHERFGSRLWPVTLRRDVPNLVKRNHSVAENLSLGFSMIDPIEPKTPLELIRTPLRGSGLSSIDSTKDLSQTRLLDRTSDEYLLTKTSKLGKLLATMSPYNTTQASTLVIEGKNKLEIEVNTFMRRNQDKDVISISKDFLQPRDIQETEEVFEEHYDKTKMLRSIVSQ